VRKGFKVGVCQLASVNLTLRSDFLLVARGMILDQPDFLVSYQLWTFYPIMAVAR
jgi:hypothetical protein